MRHGVARWLLAVLVASAAGSFVPAAGAQELKVGYVNVARVLEVAPQALAAQERINQEFAPRDQGLLEQQRELREREDELLSKAATLNDTERTRQESEIRSLKRDLRRVQEEFREDLSVRRSEELSKLQRQVAETIRAMAESENYDLVLSNGVVYAGARVDLTNAVIELLEKEAQ